MQQEEDDSVLHERPIVLVGHSQGGLIVQEALQRSVFIRNKTQGVVLLGSMRLGYLSPDIMKQKENICSDKLGYLSAAILGKLRNVEYGKRLFLLSAYFDKLLKVSASLRLSIMIHVWLGVSLMLREPFLRG